MRMLITGGARSGKSRHAQEIAESLGEQRTYIATAEAGDDDMAARIRRHREARGPGWTTVEEPLDPARAIAGDVVLIDCLTLWVSNLIHARDDVGPDFDRLLHALGRAPGHVLVVTNEVGLGIVPDSPLARRYRDELGRLNQRVATACDRVVMMIAGLPLRVK